MSVVESIIGKISHFVNGVATRTMLRVKTEIAMKKEVISQLLFNSNGNQPPLLTAALWVGAPLGLVGEVVSLATSILVAPVVELVSTCANKLFKIQERGGVWANYTHQFITQGTVSQLGKVAGGLMVAACLSLFPPAGVLMYAGYALIGSGLVLVGVNASCVLDLIHQYSMSHAHMYVGRRNYYYAASGATA